MRKILLLAAGTVASLMLSFVHPQPASAEVFIRRDMESGYTYITDTGNGTGNYLNIIIDAQLNIVYMGD